MHMQALQINLDHPHVAKVHVLCKDNSEMQYVVHSKLNNSDKLLFQHIGHDLCFSDVFRYIGENLLGETAMQLNIDCFLEQGWHQLNNTLLQDKTMYALTRHETDYSIKHCNGIEFCPNDRTATQGSHDAFIVNLISPLPEAMLKQMEILKLPYGGIEQALISLFRKYGFKVAKVHVLCKDNSEMQYVVHSKLNNSDKLLFQHIGHDLCFSDVFRYIGENLLGETAMQLNIDCFLEQGWHQLNNTLLQDKTMYALTRHETDYSIKHCNGIEFCPNDRTATQGSHDAFIVNLISPLPEAMLKQMEILKLPYGGIEQALISLFRKYGFKVKNPCRILRIFHHHCSQYRDMEQKYIKGQRIDHFLGIGGSSGLVYNTGL
ncbi:predicted protein [Nematostella vectensis]|uniref:Uncharacterized protein n=1 Tax=Nematostella vectensis TaxID=45351 RepID=A7SYS3_NEMVE|nr:predicted protein [Nematostella vectensis]|eukprot:XP_001623240.1 predicted protein [Nematostella vectensis]